MKPWKPALAIVGLTLLVGLLGLVVPALLRLETDIGLLWLFNLRGTRPAPEQIILVGVDRSSAQVLGLPANPRIWPRSHHARVVKSLARLGAQVIVFDMRFEEPREKEQDRQFAQALTDAGNVILFQYLEHKLLTETADMVINVQHLRRPIPELADAAAGLAPFTLPRTDARIDWVWTFKSDTADVPTIPAVALQQYALRYWDSWLALLHSQVPDNALRSLERYGPGGEQPDTAELTRVTRILFQAKPILQDKMRWRLDNIDQERRPAIDALIHLYTGPDSRLLDFYGPDRSFRFVPYQRLLKTGNEPLPDFSDAAVFVGYTEQIQPEQRDGFYTVFTPTSGYNVNGVEILATTFANLLERRFVRPLPPWLHLLSIVAWGFILTTLFLRLPVATALMAVPALAIGLMSLSVYLFSSIGLWLPIVTFLLFQLPTALVGTILWRYRSAQRDRQRIRKAFSYFLPESALAELVTNLSPSHTPGKLVYAVCLSTDVEQYTALAERMDPGALRGLLNRYFQLLFEPIQQYGGTISDAVGDSILAIWASTEPRRQLHQKAVMAAVEILNAVAAFNVVNPDTKLPTRIGVHGGEIALGHVGAHDRFEYRPVGDIVNTTSRIEGLCKQLGTYTLVSEEIAAGLEGIATRSLGQFRMVGKQQAIGVREIICSTDNLDVALQSQISLFAAALEEFQASRFSQSADQFRAICERFPHDRPSAFFYELSKRYEWVPPKVNWDGVVPIHNK